MVEQLAVNELVVGSSPTRGADEGQRKLVFAWPRRRPRATFVQATKVT